MPASSAPKPIVVSPRALIHDGEGRYLFVQRSAGSAYAPLTWEPPGGKMDPGETVDQTLAREVREETGLVVRDLRLAGACEGETASFRVIALIFEADLAGGELRLSDEHAAFQWVTPAEAMGLELSPAFPAFIARWAGLE